MEKTNLGQKGYQFCLCNFAGLAFTIPYALTGIFLGAEFPSLIGALVGLPIVIFAAKKRFLVPKDLGFLLQEKMASYLGF